MDLLNNKKADASLGGALKDLEVEAKGFEDAPQWLRDQYWKKDLEERRKLGLEPSVY